MYSFISQEKDKEKAQKILVKHAIEKLFLLLEVILVEIMLVSCWGLVELISIALLSVGCCLVRLLSGRVTVR